MKAGRSFTMKKDFEFEGQVYEYDSDEPKLGYLEGLIVEDGDGAQAMMKFEGNIKMMRAVIQSLEHEIENKESQYRSESAGELRQKLDDMNVPEDEIRKWGEDLKKDMAVFMINDCDYVATTQIAKDTIKWYEEEFGEDVESCELLSLCNDGIWCEIREEEAYGHIYSKEKSFGNVRMFFGKLCQYRSLESLIGEYDESKFPIIIASTEY